MTVPSIQTSAGGSPAAAGSRTLVVSSRLSVSRRAALERVLAGMPRATFVAAGAGLPCLGPFDAILLDGPPDLGEADVSALRARVEAGAALVTLGAPDEGADDPLAELLGTRASAPMPESEVVVTAAGDDDLTRRLDAEFPVMDRFRALVPRNGHMRTLLTVSVALRHRAAAVAGRLGAGRIVVFGLGATDAALAHDGVSLLVRRALRGVPPSASRTLGVAIVGYGPYGGMGYAHGLAVGAVPGMRFLAACDSVPERRAAAQADFPGLRTYAAAEELAADPDVDVVIVATPPVLHARLAGEMLAAGKHVVCEKPLCLTVAEADELLAAAAAAGRVLTVNHNRRWDPDFTAIRAAAGAGLLGDVFNVETFVGGFDHPCRAWHSDVSMSGGAVYDWGSHHVDWILQLMGGLPRSVTCIGHKRVWHDVTNLDQLRLRMLWEDGREAQFLQSDVAAVRPPKFWVQGTRGTLAGWYRPLAFERVEAGRGYVREDAHHAEAPVSLTLSRYESGYGLVESVLPPAPERRLGFHRNLADHLLLGEPLAVTPESARDVIAVLEAATRSAERGGASVCLAGAQAR